MICRDVSPGLKQYPVKYLPAEYWFLGAFVGFPREVVSGYEKVWELPGCTWTGVCSAGLLRAFSLGPSARLSKVGARNAVFPKQKSLKDILVF